MNKKEQAEMERLRDELRIAKAFRFTESLEPDVPVPQTAKVVSGWQFNVYVKVHHRVENGCSNRVSHSSSSPDRPMSQHPVRQFSTKLLALLASRSVCERQCAKALADIDRKIEEAKTA